MKQPNNYFTVRTVQTSTCLEFADMSEFCQFAKAHQLSDVFLLLNEENETSHFGIIYNHIMFRQPTLGFCTLEDYSKAVQSKFPDSTTYYEAAGMGYQNYDDYKLVKEAGICDKAVFDKIKSTHFISGFTDHQTWLQSNPSVPALPLFANPYELYTYATEHGFTDYTHFRKAVSKGFTDAGVYNVASENGFPLSDDYNEGLQRGFRLFSDLKFAREAGLRDYDDMIRFNDLNLVHCTNCCHDQKVLLSLLSKIEQGKKISINKLKDLFSNTMNEYRYSDTSEMPSWFASCIHEDEDLIGFLHKNEQAKKFGHYDIDGEYFEISRMKDRSVVIDGSNIAHNSHGNAGSKPLVANIIKVVEHLKSEGFTDITVITDASLKHRLQDGNKLPQLKQMITYLEAPGETPADVFLIQHVKKNQCLLISNDTFKEWKVKDRWTAENIDFYRMAFMINGEQVLMPDIK